MKGRERKNIRCRPPILEKNLTPYRKQAPLKNPCPLKMLWRMVKVGDTLAVRVKTEFSFVNELSVFGSVLSAVRVSVPGVPGSISCCRF